MSSGPGSKPTLLCFEEEKASSNPRQLSCELSSAEPVVLLDVLESRVVIESQESGHDLVIVYRDGSMECLTADLSSSLWTGNICKMASESGTTLVVEYACISDATATVTGFLKGREDIVAQLQGQTSGNSTNLAGLQILCAVTKDKNADSLYLTLTAIRSRTSKVASNFGSTLHHLITWELPRPVGFNPLSTTSSFTLSASTGHLHVTSSGRLTTYDFTAIAPRISSQISEASFPVLAHLNLQGFAMLAASGSAYTIYDVKYNSIQDRRPINAPNLSKSRKRKRTDDAHAFSNIRFIDYFSKLRLAVALQDNELVAVQTEPQSSFKRGSTMRLVDVLGKGMISTEGGLSKGVPDSDWLRTKGELEEFAAKKDSHGFDQSFASALGIQWKRNDRTEDDHELVWALDPDSNGETLQWDFAEYCSRTAPGAICNKALAALRLIFGRGEVENASEKSAFRIQFFPPNVFHWLVVTGQLTTGLIEQSMRQAPTGSQWSTSLSKTELISAVVSYDPEFSLLHSILIHHTHLEAEDLIQAVKFIIQSLDNSTLPAPKVLLSNGNESEVNKTLDQDVDTEADAAMKDLDRAISTLEHGLPIRGETLLLALTQLNAFPAPMIIDVLRSLLTQHEIIFLIHILRIELADGGWTSRYIDAGPVDYESDATGEPSDGAITVISRLLSCAIDAIGISGWLATSAIDPVDSVDELLVSLRAETSAALEGIHEATFMKGLLGEFLRYGHRKENEYKPAGANKPLLEVKTQTVLPLGLKVETPITPIRTNAGGQIKVKSKRLLGLEISMKVPKYSFERIRI